MDHAHWEADAPPPHIASRHHGYCREVLPVIEANTRALAREHGETHPAWLEIAAIAARVRREMASHMAKEEGILFPYIDALAARRRGDMAAVSAPFGDIGAPIQMMEAEHEATNADMARIRALTRECAPPASASSNWQATLQALAAFDEDLQVHVHLENDVLFPKARALAGAAPAAAG